MKKYVIIEADTNDGDYISEKNLITDEHIQTLKEIIGKLPRQKKYGGGFAKSIPFETGEMGNTAEDLIDDKIITLKEAEFLRGFLPFGEYGIHTIESVDILTVLEEEFLLT